MGQPEMTNRTWKSTISTGVAAFIIILAGIGLLIFGLVWLYFLLKAVIEEGMRDSFSFSSNLTFGLFMAAIGAYMIYLPFEEAVKRRIGRKEIPPPPPPPLPPAGS
jgi:hypothetical protein